jgi:RimJ/RimL family protein N-acetyltransferase
LTRLVFDQHREVAEFVAQHADIPLGFANYKAIGVVRDDALIAGVVYSNWAPQHGVIEMSAAASSPKWLLGDTLHEIFAYPFEQIGCQMVVLRVSEKNKRMIRIAKRFGFNSYLIPRLRGRDEGEYIFTLTDEQWRKTLQETYHHGQRLFADSS